MENVLKIQTNQLSKLNEIEKIGKESKEIQTAELERSDNVVKLFKDIEKNTRSFAKDIKSLTGDQAKEITDKSTGRRNFRTVSDRVGDLKDNVKDFFTLRGFLDKTGISERGSGGIASEYLDRREDRQKYVKSREEVDPQYVRMVGKDKARETFANQYTKQQETQRAMTKNEKRITELSEMGFDEKAIGRTGRYKTREALATEMAKVDTRVRPEGFDARTGKIKDSEAPEARRSKEEKQSNVLSFAAAKTNDDESESAMESARAQSDQLDILRQIEENTRGGRGDASSVKVTDEGGLGDMLKGIMGSAVTMLKTGFMSALKFIFNPANILRFVTKIFLPAMIIGSVVNGIIDGFKTFFETGSITEALIAGLGGILEFLTFGLVNAESIKKLINFVGTAVDEYIVQPLMTVFEPIVDFFKNIKDTLVNFVQNFGIPEFGFTIPLINKKVSIGPFYPFRDNSTMAEQAADTPQSKPAKVEGKDDGTKVTTYEDGTRKEEGGFGAKTYDKSGKLVSEKSPTFAGTSTEKFADGSQARTFQKDGMKYKEILDKDGKVIREAASMDLGLTTVNKETRGSDLKPGTSGPLPERVDPAVEAQRAAKVSVKPADSSSISVKRSGLKIAGEDYTPGQPLSEKQMIVIGAAKSMGNSYSPEVEAQYEKQMKTKGAAPGTQTGNVVAAQSAENEAAKQKASGGGNTVVAPTTNVNNSSSSTFAVKSPTRNNDESFNRYANKAYAF